MSAHKKPKTFPHAPPRTSYVLQDISTEYWRRIDAAAKEDGVSIRRFLFGIIDRHLARRARRQRQSKLTR
jgi:hypothetical protein